MNTKIAKHDNIDKAALLASTLGTSWLWDDFGGQCIALVATHEDNQYVLFFGDEPGVQVNAYIARKLFGADFERGL